MKNDGYENVSRRLGPKEIGLGWLTGITEWHTPKAVAHRPHHHPHIELIFCLKGSLVYEVAGHGTVTVNNGAGMVIPANTVHVLKGGTDAPCERLGLHVAKFLSPRHRYAVFTAADFAAFHATMTEKAVCPFRLDARLQSDVKELARLVRTDPLSSAERGFLRALCCTILYSVADTLAKPLTAPRPQMMDEAVRFLETHHDKRIGAEDLIRHMGYGRTQLFHLFKEHTGLTPNEYLVRLRIAKAKALLASGRRSVSEVAKAVGFASPQYFKTVFLRYTGRPAGKSVRRSAPCPATRSAAMVEAKTDERAS